MTASVNAIVLLNLSLLYDLRTVDGGNGSGMGSVVGVALVGGSGSSSSSSAICDGRVYVLVSDVFWDWESGKCGVCHHVSLCHFYDGRAIVIAFFSAGFGSEIVSDGETRVGGVLVAGIVIGLGLGHSLGRVVFVVSPRHGRGRGCSDLPYVVVGLC